jgi:hypothetical protein
MCRLATDGRHLAHLVREAVTLCRAAQQRLPARTGPGRPHAYQPWQLAVLIVVAVAHRRKSKTSQYRFLAAHAGPLLAALGLARLPSRATYMGRYAEVHALYDLAIERQGRLALSRHVCSARVVAADKSLLAARGPPWHRGQRRAGRRPRGLDDQAAWGYGPHDGWVWGYSYEVVVCATKNGLVFPLLASADTASRNEHRSFAQKVPRLPRSTRDVLADGGYDGNDLGDAVEYDRRGRRTRRRFLCPMQGRGGRPALGRVAHRGRRERRRRRRAARARFYDGVRGRRLYALRGRSVEPFHQWFKQLFELEHHAWHRGLGDNRTMLLAAVFCYQLLVRHAFTCGRRDGQIQWILDAL